MQFPQTGSWQFREADPQLLHLALYARDAGDLPVPAAADVPPRLAGQIAPASPAVAVDEQALAAQQWRTWWDSLITHVARDSRRRPVEDNADFLSMLDSMRHQHDQLLDPPEFRALEAMPVLRRLVAVTYEPALKWLEHQPDRAATGISWEAAREAAESTAAERGVALGDLDATVYVLDVDGQWSSLVAPGCALCSRPLLANPVAARTLLRAAFASSGSGA